MLSSSPPDGAASGAVRARARNAARRAGMQPGLPRGRDCPPARVGAELFWGADAMPLAGACFSDPGLLERGEMARLAAAPFGVERRRGG